MGRQINKKVKNNMKKGVNNKKGNKHWPIWVKGGLIGVVVFIVFLIIATVGDLMNKDLSNTLVFQILIPTIYALNNSVICNILLKYVAIPMVYFLIGAIIGWIIEKMYFNKQPKKSSKKPNKKQPKKLNKKLPKK